MEPISRLVLIPSHPRRFTMLVPYGIWFHETLQVIDHLKHGIATLFETRGPARRFNRQRWEVLLESTNRAPQGTTIRYTDGNNRSRFKGSSGLKQSQIYPSEFGREVR